MLAHPGWCEGAASQALGSFGYARRTIAGRWRSTSKSRHAVRTAIPLVIVVLMVVSVPCRSSADPTPYSGPTLSGLATNALALAYEASGLDSATPAPFRLQGYVVTLHTAGDYFQVTFSANTSTDVQDVVVDAKTRSVIRKYGDPTSKAAMPDESEGYVLPGIIAGELILAHREAQKENYRPLQSGAYAVHFEPFPGGLNIGFERTLEPHSTSVIPAPTPTPPSAMRCISGCATGPGYRIIVRDGRITIKRVVSL